MATQVHTQVYARTHSITFLIDNLRNTLRDVISESGLSPESLIQSWETIERGLRTWLDSGHLSSIVVEFFKPGSSVVSARWDFPIGYDGSGVADDMWRDRNYLRQLIAKSARPSSDCNYRIVLWTRDGAPTVFGFTPCTLLSTGQLAARQAGTVISTGHMTAGATYWR
jgi:Bacterial HORMA domain 2